VKKILITGGGGYVAKDGKCVDEEKDGKDKNKWMKH
jgi:hypothetical protein